MRVSWASGELGISKMTVLSPVSPMQIDWRSESTAAAGSPLLLKAIFSLHLCVAERISRKTRGWKGGSRGVF